MRVLLKKLANTGIDENTPHHLKNKLLVFNNANLVIFFISLFYTSIGLVNGFYIAISVTGYSFFSNILAFVLVHKRKYAFAFHYTMFYAFVFLSAFSLLFGGANNSYYYFLFLPVVCNILFDDKKITIAYLLISAFLMIANVYFIDHYKPHYELQFWMRWFSYPNILFAALLIFVGVKLFKDENNKYAAKIEEQKETLEEKNREITDSINYAKRIQSALIPQTSEFKKHFPESFVLFKPKDIVSGDFYWITKRDNKIYYVTADCTGHGVPGGFMTMLGISFLEQIINDSKIEDPSEILNQLRDRIIHTLKQSGNAGESKDGMDLVLCCIDEKSKTLKYAAANNSLYIYRNGNFMEYKPDKQPCGFYHEIKPFTQTEIMLETGDIVYTFTDGFADQFGGPKGKKFKYKQLEELIKRSQNKGLYEQHKELDDVFEDWKGNLEQVDDVCVIGVRI